MSAMSEQTMATRKSEVLNELEGLKHVAQDLHGLVNVLLERLTPVLRNEPNSPEKALEPVGPPISTPYALAVREVSEELSTIIRKVSYVNGRLEI